MGQDATRAGELEVALPERTDARLVFIGRIRTPFAARDDCPRQGSPEGPECRIEIDELHAGKGRKLLDPRVDVLRLDGKFFTLDELNDATVLEVDGWDQHCVELDAVRSDWGLCTIAGTEVSLTLDQLSS